MKRRDQKTLLRVVTSSESETFACERMWWFRYVEGLTPSTSPAPLRQGSLVGRCIEAWARSGSTMTADEVTAAVIDPWWEERQELWRDGKIGDEEHTQNLAIRDQSEGMVRGYVARWASDAEEFETIAVEAQVARWLTHPVTGKPLVDWQRLFQPVEGGKWVRKKRRWAYGGKIDRLVRRRSDRSVWLVETKTTKETNLDSYCRKLHWDPQTRGYGWALANPADALTDEVLIGEFAGDDSFIGPYRIEGVIYDVLRKVDYADRKAIEPIKSGKRLPAATTLTCTRDEYLAAVLAHGFDPDDAHHSEQLRLLEGVRFFQREAYTFSDVEVEEFGTDLAWRALQMMEAERRPFHPRQTRICTGINRGCPGGFESVCQQDGPITRSMYGRMTIRHMELTGDLAEPWVGADRAKDAAGRRLDRELAAPGTTDAPDPFAPTEAQDAPGTDPFALPVEQIVRNVAIDGAADAAEDHTDTETSDEDLFGPPADAADE